MKGAALGKLFSRALLIFASAVRREFSFDWIVRSTRMMMTGKSMSLDFKVIGLPFDRKLEFNDALDVLFPSGDATNLRRSLAEDALDRTSASPISIILTSPATVWQRPS